MTVAAEEPAGKHISLAKKVRLTLNDMQADVEVLAQVSEASDSPLNQTSL